MAGHARHGLLAANVRLERAYARPEPAEGFRVLVDRFWRAASRKRLPLDAWDKDVAPSPALRTWFGHDITRWEAFRRRYAAELRAQGPAIRRLATSPTPSRSLSYAARDSARAHARVLRDVLLGHPPGQVSDAKAARSGN